MSELRAGFRHSGDDDGTPDPEKRHGG